MTARKTPKPRIDHLKEMLESTEKRMLADTCSDQNFYGLGRFRVELLDQIEKIDPAASGKPRNGLSELERRIAERARQSKPKTPRSRAR